MKALLVDDSRTVRLVIGRMLRERGFEIFEAGNGAEALACLDTVGRFDLAMVDWNMPTMTGIEFVRAVRSEPAHDRMLIMMVTTESDDDAVAAAFAAGVNAFARKPFTRETIDAQLHQLGLVQAQLP